MFDKISQYLKDSVEELKKVNWLSMREARGMTVLVILFSLTLAAVLGLLDSLFATLIRTLAQF